MSKKMELIKVGCLISFLGLLGYQEHLYNINSKKLKDMTVDRDEYMALVSWQTSINRSCQEHQRAIQENFDYAMMALDNTTSALDRCDMVPKGTRPHRKPIRLK